MRWKPSRMVSAGPTSCTCSSSFTRSTGAVAVRLTAPAMPEHASAALVDYIGSLIDLRRLQQQLHAVRQCRRGAAHRPRYA